MYRRVRTTLTAVAATLVVVMAAGCDFGSGGSGAAAPTTTPAVGPPPPDLHATLTQLRFNEGTRLINAEITNAGETEVHVTSVHLKAAQNEPLRATPKDTDFQPGRTIALATEFGDPVCEATARDKPVFALGLADGGSIDVPLDAAGIATLHRFNERECNLQAIAAIASVRLATSFSRAQVGGQQVLRGFLIVERPTDAGASGTFKTPLRIEEVEGSVLIRLVPDHGSIPVELLPRQRDLRVPVLIGTFRCDPHALGESTQTFLLSVIVRQPGDEAQRIPVVPGTSLQRQTSSLIERSCA